MDDLDDFLASDDETFVTCTQGGQSDISSMDETFASAATNFTPGRAVNDSLNDDEDLEERAITPSELTINEAQTPPSVIPARRLISLEELTSKDENKEQKGSLSLAKTLFDSDSDDEDDEMTFRQNLNECGRSVERSLKKVEKESISKAIEKNIAKLHSSTSRESLSVKKTQSSLDGFVEPDAGPSTTPCSGVFDKAFGLKIRNPKVGSIAFDTVTEGMKKVRLSSLRPSTSLDDSVIMGCIVFRSDPKKSANGHEYMIWKVHDLLNCQDTPVKVLLFGECCKEFWKLQLGSVIALVCPTSADQQQNSQGKGANEFAVKVAKKAQVMDLGQSPSYGICKGVRADSQKCSNFVNKDLSEFCVYHVMNEARKLSSKRGTFNSISSAPMVRKKIQPSFPSQPSGLIVNKPRQLPVANTVLNSTGTMRAAGGTCLKPVGIKTVSRDEEKETLSQIVHNRSHLPGARNLMRFNSGKEEKAESSAATNSKHTSMALFVKECTSAQQKISERKAPTLGFGLSKGGSINLAGPIRAKDANNEAAKRRAIALLKSKENAPGTRPGSVKRPNSDPNSEVPSKRGKLCSMTNKDEINKLLQKKSSHENEADKEEADAAQRYLNVMEQREKVESFTTDCKEIKNVKVVTCRKCNYTAEHQSEFCMRSGHAVQRHTADKRFFKCGGCKKRAVAFGLLPSKPCDACESMDWVRVGMKDERKVTLENEKLAIRGEERIFVNK